MKKLLPAVLLALAVSSAAAAQRVEASLGHAAAFAPAAAGGVPSLTADDARAALDAARPTGRFVVRGALIGGIVGAVAGTAIMYSADEYMGAPPHILTIPLGVVVGAGVGALWP